VTLRPIGLSRRPCPGGPGAAFGGGPNHYRGDVAQPLLGVGFAAVDQAGVERILSLNKRLEVVWLLMALPGALADRVLAQ